MRPDDGLGQRVEIGNGKFRPLKEFMTVGMSSHFAPRRVVQEALSEFFVDVPAGAYQQNFERPLVIADAVEDAGPSDSLGAQPG